MIPSIRFVALASLLLAFAPPTPSQVVAPSKDDPSYKSDSWSATGKNGAVAAGGKPAVEAGLSILKKGGNAADAAVATLFALSVTDSTLFCFGGEVPILVYDAKRGVVEVVCGLGVAPAPGDARPFQRAAFRARASRRRRCRASSTPA